MNLLPMAKARPLIGEHPERAFIGLKHILIVEDNDVDMRDAERFFSSREFTVHRARTIAQAAAMIGHLYGTGQPRCIGLVLVDMHLPLPNDEFGMDGYHFIGYLNGLIAQGVIHPIPIVAVSADMTPERRKRSQALGAAMITEKPLDESAVAVMEHLANDTMSMVALADENPLWEIAADVVQLLTRNRQNVGSGWTTEDARRIITLLSPALHFSSNADRDQAKVSMERIGGREVARSIVKECRERIRADSSLPYRDELGKMVDYLLNGVTQEAMMRLTGLGRRRFNTRVDQIARIVVEIINERAI